MTSSSSGMSINALSAGVSRGCFPGRELDLASPFLGGAGGRLFRFSMRWFLTSSACLRQWLRRSVRLFLLMYGFSSWLALMKKVRHWRPLMMLAYLGLEGIWNGDRGGCIGNWLLDLGDLIGLGWLVKIVWILLKLMILCEYDNDFLSRWGGM